MPPEPNPMLTREQGLLITGSLVLMAAVTLSFALWYAKSVLIPLALALLVTYLVGPIVNRLQVQLRLPRWAAIIAVLVGLGGVGTLFGFAIQGSVNQLVQDGEFFEKGVQTLIQDVTIFIEDNTEIDFPEGDLTLPQVLQEVGAQLPASVLSGSGALGFGGDALSFLANFLINGAFVILFAVILLAGRSPNDQQRIGLWGEIDRSVQRYLATKFFASAVTGLLTWILLWILGVRLSLVFGLMAFFLNFIPSAGSIVAMVLPLPVAYLSHPESPAMVLLALLLPGGVQFLVGNIIEPRLQGDRLDLHIITVLMTLVFWTLLWGIPGAILAVPMTVVVKMVLARFETTRPIAEILAGRLPETSTESAPG